MSKIYNQYLLLKKEKKDALYLFKSGMFFIFIDEDARLVSQYFHFKLCKLNDSIVKCGFPCSNLEKYSDLLKLLPYEIKIINNTLDTTYSPKEYKVNNEINSIIDKLSCIDIENLSIQEAYSLIENLKQESINIKEELSCE